MATLERREPQLVRSATFDTGGGVPAEKLCLNCRMSRLAV